MKVAVGLRRVAAGKRTSGRRAAQIASVPNPSGVITTIGVSPAIRREVSVSSKNPTIR